MRTNIKSLLLIIILFLIVGRINAQIERETRAVWVATNFRLDWPPPTFDQEKQKKSLLEIFDNIKSKNLNTVFFQTRSNSTVMFQSSFEALSSYISGEIGGKALYDPLEFAIEQAHKKGLEIHAWINTVLCFNGTEIDIFKNPNHIAQRRPEWVIEDLRDGVKSYWLDPGLPEVREYISDLIEEMVERYDLDGVQLDYIRYPGKNFGDEFTYNVYGGDLNKDEWRRKNITDLIETINKKIKAIKPYIKLGAAPIGIYKNQEGMYGWEGFTEIYQDSREWLQKGIVDYLAPQIYWSFSDNARFDLLAKEWVENSFGRCIVLGIAAYKDEVKNEIEKMIDYSRTVSADGVAFFRYSNIKDYSFRNFSYKTYPALMTWLDGTNPYPPQNLNVNRYTSDPHLITLEWDKNNTRSQDSIKYFALYSIPHLSAELNSDYLFDVISSDKSSITLAIQKPRKVNYYFTLKSVSKLWNESIESSNVVEVKFNELSSLLNIDSKLQNPIFIKEAGSNSKILLYSNIKDKVEVFGWGDNIQNKVIGGEIVPGKNILTMPLNLSKHHSLRLIFKSNNREVELKL